MARGFAGVWWHRIVWLPVDTGRAPEVSRLARSFDLKQGFCVVYGIAVQIRK